MGKKNKKIKKYITLRAMSGPPQRTWKKLGEPNQYEMNASEEESHHARASAGTDGQGPSPPPASNKQGQEATEKAEHWANMKDDEQVIITSEEDKTKEKLNSNTENEKDTAEEMETENNKDEQIF